MYSEVVGTDSNSGVESSWGLDIDLHPGSEINSEISSFGMKAKMRVGEKWEKQKRISLTCVRNSQQGILLSSMYSVLFH